jgi:hypothetical protein
MTGPRKPNSLSSDTTCAVEQVYGRSTRLFDDERVQDSHLTLDGSVPVREELVLGNAHGACGLQSQTQYQNPVTLADLSRFIRDQFGAAMIQLSGL